MQETRDAIDAAKSAFPACSEMSGRKRSRILYKASALLHENAKQLGEILTTEQGKPLQEGIGDVKGAANFLLWYAEDASWAYGQYLASSVAPQLMLVI